MLVSDYDIVPEIIAGALNLFADNWQLFVMGIRWNKIYFFQA